MSTPLDELTSFAAIEPAGSGSMGEVWRGVHRGSGLPVALKLLRPDVRKLSVTREVQAIAALDHPSIVRLYDHGTLSNGAAWLAMEWCAHGTLADSPLQWPLFRDQLLQLVAALGHAHARHVLHRDVRLANVFLMQDDRVKLGDFGVARMEHDTRTSLVGTPTYMAPEVLRGDRSAIGPWSDLYSLGCLIWAKFTGLPPYLGNVKQMRRAHAKGRFPTFEPVDPAPDGLIELLEHLLVIDPTERAQSAAEVHHLLTQDLSSSTAVPDAWGVPDDRGSDSRQLDLQLGLLGLSSAPFHGRETELQALWQQVREVAETGRAKVQWISGAEGVGKTRCVERIAQQVQELGLGRWLNTNDFTPDAIEAWSRGTVDVVLVDVPEPSARTEDLVATMHAVRRPVLFLVTTRAPRGIEIGPMPDSVLHRVLAGTLPLTMAFRASLVEQAHGNPGSALEELLYRHHTGGLARRSDGFAAALIDPSPAPTTDTRLLVLAMLGGSRILSHWQAACHAAGDDRAVGDLLTSGKVIVGWERITLRRVAPTNDALGSVQDTREGRRIATACLPHLAKGTANHNRALEFAGHHVEAALGWVTLARQSRANLRDGMGRWAAEQGVRIAERRSISTPIAREAFVETLRSMVRTGAERSEIDPMIARCIATVPQGPILTAELIRIRLFIASMQKDIEKAMRLSTEVLAMVDLLPIDLANDIRMTHAEISIYANDLPAARRHLERALRTVEDDRYGRALFIRATLALHTRHLDRARADLALADEILQDGFLRIQVKILQLSLLTEPDPQQALQPAEDLLAELACHPRHRSLAEINIIAVLASCGRWGRIAEIAGGLRYDPLVQRVPWRDAVVRGLYGAAAYSEPDLMAFLEFARAAERLNQLDFRNTATQIFGRCDGTEFASLGREILQEVEAKTAHLSQGSS